MMERSLPYSKRVFVFWCISLGVVSYMAVCVWRVLV